MNVSIVQLAKDFVISKVDDPALNHRDVSNDIKNKVRQSKIIVSQFRRVGDLYLYLQRFTMMTQPHLKKVYDELKKHDLLTYEDIVREFESKFADYLNQTTTPNELYVGNIYTAWDISILARKYNVQSGIYLLGTKPYYQAILVKAVMEGGKYPNEWIVPGQELKYYFHSRKDDFSIIHKFNQAVIHSQNTPIYVFIKEGENRYTYSGIFKYVDHYVEPDGSKWFRLRLSAVEMINVERELQIVVEKSRKDKAKDRQDRLRAAPRKPSKMIINTIVYRRSADVIVEVLNRANGYCEGCKRYAPFLRASNNEPYLEVHHIVPLSEDGLDTVENSFALCPNCHREMHYGMQRE